MKSVNILINEGSATSKSDAKSRRSSGRSIAESDAEGSGGVGGGGGGGGRKKEDRSTIEDPSECVVAMEDFAFQTAHIFIGNFMAKVRSGGWSEGRSEVGEWDGSWRGGDAQR